MNKIKAIEKLERDYMALNGKAAKLRCETFTCPKCGTCHIVSARMDLACKCGETWVISTDFMVRNLNTFAGGKKTEWSGYYYTRTRPDIYSI